MISLSFGVKLYIVIGLLVMFIIIYGFSLKSILVVKLKLLELFY